MPRSNSLNLATTFLRLRPDASVETLPMDAGFWPRIASGKLGSFHNEYLVGTDTYTADWANWEMHPNGDETVCLLSGSATFVLEEATGRREIALSSPGDFVLVPKGTWHTAKIHSATRVLFITPGEGSEHRASP